jgi:hypothetical protein
MSERETPRTDVLDNSLIKRGRYDDRHRELLTHAYDLERENARLKEELERRQKVINDTVYLQAKAEARVTELEEHAAYEQRRAEGAVAELVEVHAKLADTERKYLDAWRESQVERELAKRAEEALADARYQCVGSCFK